MNKKINTALISVFYKEGLEPLVQALQQAGVTLYSTGGTQSFIEGLGATVIPVENVTGYPSILGGRVKTLHPSLFGGILGRRNNETDMAQMQQYNIPQMDLVIVDLYPFEETLAQTDDEALIIEKIDIGGPSMIRAAAKNFSDVTVVALKEDYPLLVQLLENGEGEITLEQRRNFAAKAFRVVMDYDIAINNYFNTNTPLQALTKGKETILRYGENPHQQAQFYGNLEEGFEQLHGKDLSYNNLVDVDAAIELIREASLPLTPSGRGTATARPTPVNDAKYDNDTSQSEVSAAAKSPLRGVGGLAVFVIIKHTNVCGIGGRSVLEDAWMAALAGDPESAFGGVLICNKELDEKTAQAINEIFFEVLLAPSFSNTALTILKSKKNRILLQLKEGGKEPDRLYKNVINGTLTQDKDTGNCETWNEAGGRQTSEKEKDDLLFANIVCKHLKSNAIALVKDKQLIGKGCGQTSRIDALRQAIEKAKQFNFDLSGAVLASDAFFPFNDCVKMGHQVGITAFIQPGGSIRDKDSIDYCKEHNLAMVLTGMRHFKH